MLTSVKPDEAGGCAIRHPGKRSCKGARARRGPGSGPPTAPLPRIRRGAARSGLPPRRPASDRLHPGDAQDRARLLRPPVRQTALHSLPRGGRTNCLVSMRPARSRWQSVSKRWETRPIPCRMRSRAVQATASATSHLPGDATVAHPREARGVHRDPDDLTRCPTGSTARPRPPPLAESPAWRRAHLPRQHRPRRGP